MTQGRWEDDTMPLARPLDDTLELPVVPAEPAGAGDAPTTVLPPTPDAPTAPVPPAPARPVPPAWVAVSPPSAVPAPGTAPEGTARSGSVPPDRPARPRRRRSLLLPGLLALLVVLAIAVGSGRLARNGGLPGGSGSSRLAVQDVTDVDPSGGSGLRRGGSTADPIWRTQRYRSADFGNLKSGVGLLLDLGRAREVTAVRVTSDVPGTALDLRAGSSAAAARRADPVARTGSADGTVTLRVRDGGRHRYWLLWVPRLGRDGSGYRAQLHGITVSGRAG